MKKASPQLLSEITELIKAGMTQQQISDELSKQGKLTPNGKAWSQANVAHYVSTHRLTKKARIARMKELGTQTRKQTTMNDASLIEDKIKAIISLGLSKDTLIKVLSEVV